VAEDVAAGSSPRPAAAKPAAPSREEKARESAYYSRFTLAYAILAFLAAGAVGALIVILLRPAAAGGKPWSKFVPTGSPIAMELQIATKVSSEYKAGTAGRLVNVFPGPLEATRFIQSSSGPTSVQVPITLVAVQPDVSTGKHEPGDYTFFNPDSTVAYEMCGFGDSQQSCRAASVTGENPAPLLHREALELALYTLKYVPNTDAVIAYLPPPTNPQAAATAVFFARKDVTRILDRPLSRTLKTRQVFPGVTVPDAAQVDELTRSHVYTSEYQTLPGNGTSALVLTPALSGQ
jgi:hypothetical protein